MTGPQDLAKLVPGFDFLQNLMKGSGLPGVQGFGQWIAPTLDPEELDKRIQELKTVQFWLEQNARLLGTTVQALEVQRMTLSTLKTMNLPMTELREALKARAPEPAPAPPPAPEPAPAPAAEAPAPRPARPPRAAAAPAAPAIDPMQWWGALTQQFTEIAGKALKDSAGSTLKAAATMPVKAAAKAAKAAKSAAKPARRAAPRQRSG